MFFSMLAHLRNNGVFNHQCFLRVPQVSKEEGICSRMNLQHQRLAALKANKRIRLCAPPPTPFQDLDAARPEYKCKRYPYPPVLHIAYFDHFRSVQKCQIPPQAGSLLAYLRLLIFLVTQHARLLQEPTESLQAPFVSHYGTR